MCQGLPGSGKTTWALEQIGAGLGATTRVNKDDIRTELSAGGWVWSHEAEAEVLRIRNSQIEKAFLLGYLTVISDDCNFGRRHKLERLARANDATFEVKQFDTPVDECIRRDALRTDKAQVGRAVIEKMAAQYGLAGSQEAPGSTTPVVADPSLPPAIICDLDGTLSLFKAKGHRGPYDASRCAEDDCNEVVRDLLRLYDRGETHILYVSGREDTYRPQTEAFFAKHRCPPGFLWMRSAGDKRKDTVIKSELFDAHIRGQYNVLFVLDDRDSVVKFWRSIGLQCWQVAEGAF